MRVPGWQQRFVDTLHAWRGCVFEWGRVDCCQFAGAMCFALTGEDRRARFSDYDSEISAALLLAEHGGMQGLLTHAFGESIPAAFAKRGDIVLCEFGSGPQPAVVEGAMCCAPALTGGLVRRRVIGDPHYPDALMGWSI